VIKPGALPRKLMFLKKTVIHQEAIVSPWKAPVSQGKLLFILGS
jgi:hypothetical protein